MERDIATSRKRRSFLSEKSLIPVTSPSRTSNRTSPFRARFQLLCQRLTRYLYHPWILTFFIIAFTLALMLIRKTDLVESSGHCLDRLPEDSSGLPVYSTKPIKVNDQLTLMLNSFHRQDLLERSLQHYSQCASLIRQIRVIWCEEGDPPAEDEGAIFKGGVEVMYDIMNGTSLNNRFIPVKELQTEVVMSIDDDIYIPCADLHRAFKAWTINKRSLVGFFPRAHKLDQNCKQVKIFSWFYD